MDNQYLVSIPITVENEARVLGSPSAWEILDELRYAGLEGRTAEALIKPYKNFLIKAKLQNIILIL